MTAAYGPLPFGHDLIGSRCPACHVPFVARDWIAEIPIGPGGSPASRGAARSGRDYLEITVAVHWPCHTGHDNPPPTRSDRLDRGNDRDWAHT